MLGTGSGSYFLEELNLSENSLGDDAAGRIIEAAVRDRCRRDDATALWLDLSVNRIKNPQSLFQKMEVGVDLDCCYCSVQSVHGSALKVVGGDIFQHASKIDVSLFFLIAVTDRLGHHGPTENLQSVWLKAAWLCFIISNCAEFQDPDIACVCASLDTFWLRAVQASKCIVKA